MTLVQTLIFFKNWHFRKFVERRPMDQPKSKKPEMKKGSKL